MESGSASSAGRPPAPQQAPGGAAGVPGCATQVGFTRAAPLSCEDVLPVGYHELSLKVLPSVSILDPKGVLQKNEKETRTPS